MSDQLDDIKRRLIEAKGQRGRMAKIAAGSDVTPRTIYSLMHGSIPSATTMDKLAAFFEKCDRKIKKEKSA